MPATLGPPGSYTRSVLGGASDRNAAHQAGALSTVGSQQAHKQQADGQQQQAETAWSLLGKMYSSSVLAYMVAITDAQALVRRMRSMRPGPPLHLPGEVQCMDIWQVLQGVVQQQRVWTFGLQTPAALPAPAHDEHEADKPPAPSGAQSLQHARPASALLPAITAAAAAVNVQELVEPCISCREPYSVQNGVRFIGCAAGHQHSAAAAEGGYVYTWGSNDKGQLGCDTNVQQPIAVHVLSTPELDCSASCSAAGNNPSREPSTGPAHTAGSRAMLNKLDSLKLLGNTVKLPPSLLASLQQQRKKEREEASEQQQQQHMLLQELLQHPELGQQQQLAGRPPAPQPNAAQAAAHMAVLSGINSSKLGSELPAQQQVAGRPQALVVYQLHLGQAVRSVACGAHHTLAALASSGLMGWGSNDKGQLGVPAGLYREVHSPKRIHGFDGQRLTCISAGAKHSAAVQEGGTVVTWGHGRYGRLGVGGTPDILPPSVVAGLRGCCVVQVACGTAHTLALTADGRVYACGFNGQGALGTGDEQDRLYPVLVPGLPSCVQVAAAASSMALSSDGQVFMWGGAAAKKLQQHGSNGSSASTQAVGGASAGADGTTGAPGNTSTSSSSMQKTCVPWLAGVRAVHITCGVETAAAVSSSGEVLLWGSRSCLPDSMMGGAQSLRPQSQPPNPQLLAAGTAPLAVASGVPCAAQASAQGTPTAAEEGQCDRQHPGAAGTAAAACEDAGCTGDVTVQLLVQGAGCEQHPVKVVLLVHPQQHAAASGTQQIARRTRSTAAVQPPAAAGSVEQQQQCTRAQACSRAALPAPARQGVRAKAQGQAPLQQGGSLAAGRGFDPQEEPVADTVCGASHQVVLCQPSQHVPSQDELRAAILAVLRAYISSFNSTNTSSLNLLMQQQQLQAAHQSEANWAGSIVGGPAKSTKSARHGGYGGSVVSFAGSTGRAVQQAASLASFPLGQQSPGLSAADAEDAGRHGGVLGSPGSIVRGGGPSVSFAGGPGPGAGDGPGTDADSVVGSGSSPGGKGAALLSKAERAVGYAASVADGSQYRGRGAAGSVCGSQVAGTVGGGRPGSAGLLGPASDCLSLHGALVLCKDVCLLDNITEHLDVIRAFQLMLHRKRGRLGPAHTAAGQPAPHPAADSTRGSISCIPAGSVAPHGPSGQETAAGAAAATAAGSPAVHGALDISSMNAGDHYAQPPHDPGILTIVHVLRPNEPAVAVAATAADHAADGCVGAGLGGACGSNSRPASPGPGVECRASSGSSRPGSSGRVMGKQAVGRAAAAASGMDSITSLDAGEMLEMLLLLMKERHPCYRRQPTALLQMLAGWHLTRLQGRKSDQGPPWLLRQALQPDILTSIESSSSTELLHGIYVHLAGSSANIQDLSMHLADMRLGLRCAAGFMTPQDLLRQQQKGQRRQQQSGSLKPHAFLRQGSSANSSSSSRALNSSNQSCGYQSGTESSRYRTHEPIPYSISMHTPVLQSSRSKRGERSSSTCGSDACGGRTFQLPLYKLAAFIRTAKLLPRLLDKYLVQLQLKGQEQRIAPGGQRVDGLPVMPCLQLNLQQQGAWAGAGASYSGQRRRPSIAPGDPQQQHTGLLGEASRLPPLKETSSVASSLGASVSGQRQGLPVTTRQQQQGPGFRPDSPDDSSSMSRGSYSHADSFFEPVSSQRVRAFPRSGSTGSIRGSATGAAPGTSTTCRSKLSVEGGGRTARESQQGGAMGRGGVRGEPVQMPDASMVDASALNSAELLPVRSAVACIQLVLQSAPSGAAIRVRSAGGSSSSSAASKVLVPLLPGGTSAAVETAAPKAGSRSASAGGSGQGSQYGSAAWIEVVESQQAQGGKGHAGRQVGSAKATYQQQQAALQKQRQVEAASAELAEAREAACQDVWIACMLVELLGSSLITPHSSAAVKLPPPAPASTVPAPAAADGAAAARCQGCTLAEGGDLGCGADAGCDCGPQQQPADSGDSGSSSSWCVWDRGYCFIAGEANSNADLPGFKLPGVSRSAGSGCSAGSSGNGSRAAAGGVGDLLNHCISYPQFVEVLCCLMAARSVSILEPDVKQIRGLALDEEMQDHARVVMEHIMKWRANQLTPWKQAQQQGPAGQQQSAATASATNTSAVPRPGAAPAAPAGPTAAASLPSEGRDVVCGVYAAYSSMRLGSSVLGLHRDGYLQLLKDAGMVSAAGSSDLSPADALCVFDGVATASSAAAATKGKSGRPASPARAGPVLDSLEEGSNSSSGARPAGLGPEQRQSTFMRCVTQQLLQRLEVGGAALQGGAAAVLVGDAGAVEAADTPVASAHPACTAAGAAGRDPQAAQATSGQQARPQAVSAALEDDSESGRSPGSTLGPGSSAASSRPCSSTTGTVLEGGVSSNTSRPVSTGTAGSADTAASSAISRSSCESEMASEAAACCPADGTARGSSDADAGRDGGRKDDGVLTAAQFLQAMVLLSRRCFPRIANGSRAWKLLLERHVQPLADKKRSRYDRMSASLSTPGIVALLTAWQPQLQQLHRQAAMHARANANANTAAPQAALGAPSSHHQGGGQQGVLGADAQGLSLTAFLEVLQEKAVIPQLLEPCDVQEVLRQLLVTQADQDAVFCSLRCNQFVHALSMCGLAAFSSRRMQHSPLQEPEQQLAAFLAVMGLTPLPGQQLAAPAAAAGAAGDAGAGSDTRPGHGKKAQRLRQQLAPDPYIEWWSLQFDPAAESRAHDHLSSLNYLPVMLQEVVQPPSCCPPDVLPLLTAAQTAQQARDIDGALTLLETAEQTWRSHLQQQQVILKLDLPHGSVTGGSAGAELPAVGVLYLAVSAAGCLLSAGRDDEALGVLQGCAEVLAAVHEAGADAAVWHAAAGVAKYHCDDWRGAYEHCVRAYVIRSECTSLGPRHPDTAAAGHNLGVVLNCLGKCSRGLQLVQEARQVFATALGPQHVRTLVAARNEQHIKHKIIKLPAQPQELLAAAAAPGAANGAAHPRTTSAGLPRSSVGGPHGRANIRSSSTTRASDAASISGGSSSDTNSSTDEDQPQQGGKKGKEKAKAGQSPGGKGGGTSKAGGTGPRSSRKGAKAPGDKPQGAAAGRRGVGSRRELRQTGSMQERLESVMHARQHKEEAAQGQQQQQEDTRDYTDYDHLGGGVFKATAEQQQLYKAFVADVKAHAQGASTSSSYGQQPGVVEMQVLKPTAAAPPAAAAGASGRAAAAAGAGMVSAGSVLGDRVVSAGRAAAALGRTSGSDSTRAGRGAGANPKAGAAAGAGSLQGGAAAGASELPSGAVRQAVRGPLADATIAAVKKPLSIEQQRRLRRRQQLAAAAAKRGKGSGRDPDLLDKLY